jgi:hypothetical protein
MESNENQPFDKTMKTLSVRQPYAEEIMRGIKKEEYRSIPTNFRGRVYIYASNTLADEEPIDSKTKNEDLPRGVIIGSVEITNCYGSKKDGYAWPLANPQRLDQFVKPVKKPQPVWFYPF